MPLNRLEFHDRSKLIAMLAQIEGLEASAMALVAKHQPLLDELPPENRSSAQNLLHYLAIRAIDLRALQQGLSEMAISSIGHSESHTLDHLLKIKCLVATLAGVPEKCVPLPSQTTLHEGHRQLHANTERLLGTSAQVGHTRIMVTLGTETAEDPQCIHNLVAQGMDIARINTAHDDATVWEKMIRHVKAAAKTLGKPVKIYMDIQGPKIRTGKIQQSDGQGWKKEPAIRLYKGTLLTLTKSAVPGHGGPHPVIPLTSPEIFGHVKAGEGVLLDDGKIGGTIHSADDHEIVVMIERAPDKGVKLKSEKGVTFPESCLDIPALTAEDIEHLSFIAQHADMVGFSFVQRPTDLAALQAELQRLCRTDMGIILKIETPIAFQNLPSLLLEGLKSANCGVMIARGDLAVSIGFQRMAEVQEEILWLAEAAHLPVIWATQVLETQVKKGLATRAEISDVVKAVRAECVMLNKGEHLLEAMETIMDIDVRMAAHEDKKRRTLRSLGVAKAFVDGTGD